MAHKASLLLQAALGCVDLSDVPEVVRRQIMLDTSLLFERMHRLVRAVIECKASDLDGVTCRVALDLARSMAAKAWEGKPMQLTQVPQVGPVFMRKFVASGITTVHDLFRAGASSIERILSRNPPFGKKMTDELAHFPCLTLEARITTRNPRIINPSAQPVARIDAVLGCSNSLGKLKWRGKVPSVTFMAETTEGVLAHWWRGSMKKFKEEDEHKFSLQFEVDLRSVKEEITCHFACEDIVGTVVTKELEHGLPASAFPSKTEPTPQLSKTLDRSAEPLMDDDICDNDLLEIAKVGQDDGEACLAISGDSSIDSEFPSIDGDGKNRLNDRVLEQNDDLGSSRARDKENIPWQPIQLPNGKFKCNHHCADAGLKNSNGKACAHRCCREGLEAPRKPKPSISKRKAGLEEIVVTDPASQTTSKPSTKRIKKTILKGKASTKSPARQPLTSASSNRQDRPMMDLDDFDLDGDGLIDLTQVDCANVDGRQSSHRSPYRVKKPTRKDRLLDDEVNLFEDVSDDTLQDDFGSSLGSRGTPKDNRFDAGKGMLPLHAEFLETQSNGTDNFSGDSVFDGVTVGECHGQSSHPRSALVGTVSVLNKRPGDTGEVPLQENPGVESSLEEEPISNTPPTMSKYVKQPTENSHFEKGSRAKFAYPSPNQFGMASRVEEADSTSPTMHSMSDDVPKQQEPVIEMEAKELEDETYIFSDKYALPPPRDSLGEGNVILPRVSSVGCLSSNADATAVPESGRLDDRPSTVDHQLIKMQGDSEWEGFEPGFTDEFRDLVEFI